MALAETPPGWQEDGQRILREYRFADFVAAMRFVNQLADHAEKVEHHPDIDIRYNRVTVALTTHDAGGVTDKDRAFARDLNTQFPAAGGAH